MRLTNGITDLTGNPITATTWNFTTEAAPAIAGRTPAVNGTNVATNRNLAVTFSEPVRGVSSSTVTLKTSAGKLVPTTVSYNAAKRTATVKPKGILPSSTRFTVSLSNGITDVNGNRLAASSWSFKTESRPTVSKRTAAAGAKSVEPKRQRPREVQRSSLRSKPLQLQAGRQQGQDCFGQGQLQLAHQDGDLESVEQVEGEGHL